MFATTTNDTVNPSSNEHRIIPTHPHKHRKKVMKTNTNFKNNDNNPFVRQQDHLNNKATTMPLNQHSN